MDTEFKEKWIAALRSGEYKQGNRKLRKEVYGELQYCCLGVLCEVTGLGEWKEERATTVKTYYFDPGDLNFASRSSNYPPVVVEEAVRIKDEQFEALVHFNDTEGWTFEQIADWIEENL